MNSMKMSVKLWNFVIPGILVAAAVGCGSGEGASAGAAPAPATSGGLPASAESAVVLKAPNPAPNGNLTDLNGKATDIKTVLGGKPTVLVFYRGGWCPFCNAHLSELGRMEAQVRAKGYQIVAVSPEGTQEINATAARDDAHYKIFSDSSADTMKKFGVAYQFNGPREDQKILPVPSLFLIDKGGTVTFVHSNPNYSQRMSGAELLAAIEKQKQS